MCFMMVLQTSGILQSSAHDDSGGLCSHKPQRTTAHGSGCSKCSRNFVHRALVAHKDVSYASVNFLLYTSTFLA
jgi:hypothetical protein